MRVNRNARPSFVSIFSGCGGFDLGFMQAGFNCVGAFDIDPLVIQIYKSNLKSPAFVYDLSDGLLPINLPSKPDVLLAGTPCQGFSTVGKRNLNDPRNELLLAAGRIVKEVEPKVFIAENVAGVRSGAHSKYWEALKTMLREASYQTAEFLCEGNRMGVPQIRKRAVLLAWNTGKTVDIKIPHIEGGTLRTALANLHNVPNHHIKKLLPTCDIALIAKNIKCGQKLSNVRGGERAVHTWEIPEVFGRTTKRERVLLEAVMRIRRQHRVRAFGDADPVPITVLAKELGHSVSSLIRRLEVKGYVRRIGKLYDLTHTFNGKFRRLDLDQPSLTVDTRFGDPRYFLHPTQDRGFTVREAARIQGFPDSFFFDGAERAQYRMVGNAVPPPLARNLAAYVKSALLS